MSNEQREQQMMDAADRYADEVCDESCTGAQVAETINDFCEGWRAADSYPNWISVEERLPEKDNEFEDYSKLVVVTDGKDFYKGMYYYGWECWVTHDLWPIKDATHWMEVQLPQPPRKEDKMDEIKVGDKVLIYYFAFELEGIVTSIDGDIVKGEITSPLKYFKAPKDYVFPIKEGGEK